MPELNGHDATAPYVSPPQPPALAEPVKTSAKLTPAKLRDIQQRLREPFAAELVYFKPQVVSYKGADSTAKGAAYADARAYSDRLNEVVGIDGWSQTAVISTSPTYEKEIKKKEKTPQTGQWDVETSKTVRIARISAVVTVTINGVGSHSNVGESEQPVGHFQLDHGSFVDHHQISFQRILAVVFPVVFRGIVLEQRMNRGGGVFGDIGEVLRGPAGRRG